MEFFHLVFLKAERNPLNYLLELLRVTKQICFHLLQGDKKKIHTICFYDILKTYLKFSKWSIFIFSNIYQDHPKLESWNHSLENFYKSSKIDSYKIALQTHPNFHNLTVEQKWRSHKRCQKPHRDNEISGSINIDCDVLSTTAVIAAILIIFHQNNLNIQLIVQDQNALLKRAERSLYKSRSR